MWFVIRRTQEGYEVMSGPHRDKEIARMTMLTDSRPNGPEYGLAWVEGFGKVEVMHTWKEITEPAALQYADPDDEIPF